jgi:hypothetical protein
MEASKLTRNDDHSLRDASKSLLISSFKPLFAQGSEARGKFLATRPKSFLQKLTKVLHEMLPPISSLATFLVSSLRIERFS